jgi:hypothetical protein
MIHRYGCKSIRNQYYPHMSETVTPARYIRECVFCVPTQWQFAEMLGYAQATVSRMETGEIQLGPKAQRRIRDLAKQRRVSWNDSWFFEVPKGASRRAD